MSDNNSCPEIITRTYLVTDECGNFQTCEHIIELDDEENPDISCPGPLTANCDISEIPAYTSYTDFIANGGVISDNCAIDESSFTLVSELSDGNTCPEVVTRTYSISDLCGKYFHLYSNHNN